MSKIIALRPRLSEKAYALSQERNVYVFQVPRDVNKQDVAEAVADQFGVTVEDVNVMNVKGKVKRTVRRRGRTSIGKRVDFKKAYVTLKEGDSIPIFASEEEQTDAAKKESK